MAEIEEVEELEISRIIGFDGNPRNGLQIHPDGKHIVYPLGMKVAVQNWTTKAQRFLTGHTNAISAVAISRNGKYIASGQINHMGFKSSVILWDFKTCKEILRHEVHKVRVESVVFSSDSQYLISLGGRDDGNVVVWDVNANATVCGELASRGTAGDALVLHSMNVRGRCFLSAGDTTLRVWKIDPVKKHAEGLDVSLGQIKRKIECVVIDEKDINAYCGTSTGDIVKVGLNYDHDRDILNPVTNPILVGCYAKMLSKKQMFEDREVDLWSQGVTALALAPTEFEDRLVVGAGNGQVDLVRQRDKIILPDPDAKTKTPTTPQFFCLRSATVISRVTSLQILGNEVLAGTVGCEVYTIDMDTFETLLHVTCHRNAIYDICFPHMYPGVFATCGKDDIRVWDTVSGLELLRITVPNFTCSSINFAHDGKSIISGWNDGEIRSFTPQTGRLIFSILNAHNRGVTALAVSADGRRIVSGGVEGQVRVWDVKPRVQTLVGILKEHKGAVTGINMNNTYTAAVSSSADGTCIIWNLVRMTRDQIIFANTQFMDACYHPTGVQLVTCGTDRKIGYWEALDGSMLRELEGSTSSCVNSVHVSRDGHSLASGGNDTYVKLWKYRDGVAAYYGVGHAANVTRVKFSPDCRFVVSTGADGGIFHWKCPYPLPADFDDRVSETCSTRSTCSSRGAPSVAGEENVDECSSDLLETVRESERAERRETPASDGRGDGGRARKPTCPCPGNVGTPPGSRGGSKKSGSKKSTGNARGSGYCPKTAQGATTDDGTRRSTPKTVTTTRLHCKCPSERTD